MNFLRQFARRHVLTPNTIRYRIEYRLVRELIKDSANGFLGEVLLDAGAGAGQFSKMLHKEGFCKSLIGVEPDDRLVRLLEKNYGSRAKSVQGNLLNLPFEDGSVNAVISTQVFEHIEDDKKAASEVARVLGSKGLAIISTPHPPEIFPNDGHVRPGYTKEEMAFLFKEVGLEFIDARYFFTLPTLKRLTAAGELGKVGKLLPIAWADCEANLSQEEIKAQQPYGIACLFQKVS